MILSLLARIQAIASLRLRILVTSRPELPIKLAFNNMSWSLYQDVVLEEVQATIIEHDIRLYLEHRITEMKLEDSARQPYDPLPLDWPGEDSVTALVELAIPLFIFAFTVCRYIGQSDPQRRLESILQQKQSGSFSGLEKTYVPILDQLIIGSTPSEQDQIISDFRELVGSIVLLATPLSVSSLSRLLELSLRAIGEGLNKLHSVLNIPTNREAPVRLFHLSFRDFLVDGENSENHRFRVNERGTHGKLARKCLTLLSRPGILKHDICQVEKAGCRRHEVSQETIARAITSDIAYACRYWVWHLSQGTSSITDGDVVHAFLQTHFLHWMEALSWLGQLSEMVTYISTLRSLVKYGQGSQLLLLLDDARRFVLRNRQVVDLAPLQLYSSALIFTPTQSVTRQTYEKQYHVSWLKLGPGVSSNWSAEIQKLEGHDSYVNAVAFNLGGQTLASASNDKTVRLWDTSTSEQKQKFEGHDGWVNALSFSHTGQVLASTSIDQTIRLWHIETAEELRKLSGHDDWVHAVAFSHDGQMLASGSGDRTIKVWDVATGTGIQTLMGHADGVRSVDFHPSGQFLASASCDKTVRMWSLAEGKEILRLHGHEDWVNAVSFSCNGQVLASAAGDKTIRLWCSVSGDEIRKLQGHDDWVNAVDFSPDGKMLASGSHDSTIRLWSVATGKELRKFEGHEEWVNGVAFAPNREVIASVSGDRTVRLWETTNYEVAQKLEGHDGSVLAVAIASGGHVLASASEDRNIIIWDAVTGKVKQRLRGHSDTIWALAFSPDGQTLASASTDQTIRVWDTTTSEELGRFAGHDDVINALAFSPDGQQLVSFAHKQTVQLWRVRDGHEMFDCQVSWAIRDALCGYGNVSLEAAVRAVFHGLRVPPATHCPNQDRVLDLTDQWIRFRNEDLLWLPHEFRGRCWISFKDTLAIGQHSGRVSIFRFDLSRERIGYFTYPRKSLRSSMLDIITSFQFCPPDLDDLISNSSVTMVQL